MRSSSGRFRQIPSIELEQIEHVVDDVHVTSAKRALKRLKARSPVGHDDADLAIDQRTLRRQRRHRIDHGRKLCSPVVEPAAVEPKLAIDVRENPIAIELLLVEPLLTLGRLVD